MNTIVVVSALVYPTEIEENVRTAITNVFPVDLTIRNFGIPQLYGDGDLESLRKLHTLLRVPYPRYSQAHPYKRNRR